VLVAGAGFASLWIAGAVVATAVGAYTIRSAQRLQPLPAAQKGESA
jgi:hypothetical protein